MSRALAHKALAALLTLAVAAAAVLVALDAPAPSRAPAFALTGASGALVLENDRAGAAILQAPNLRPGDVVEGTVTLSAAQDVSLSLRASVGASPLGERLTLTIDDVTTPASPAAVWGGALADLPPLSLAALAAGEQRRYRFRVTFPPGVNDNALQGASVSAGFDWTAVGAAPVTPPAPAPDPDPAPAPPATPATPDAPAQAVAAARLAGLPAARGCVKRRRYRVTAKPRPGVKVKSVKLTVNGKATRRAGRRVTLDLKAQRKSKVKVRVVVTTSAGKLTLGATYKLCRR